MVGGTRRKREDESKIVSRVGRNRSMYDEMCVEHI